VIVDDASTDDSAQVVQRTLDELADPRFSLIRLDKNVGQTGAPRRGPRRRPGPLSSASSIPTICWNPSASWSVPSPNT
jgi:glycosyltransferase involved in cell wall biosynthesis